MDVSQNVSTAGGLFQSLNFQKIVLIIAIVILIISLVFIGMQIKKSNSKQDWPPLVPQCPDYWSVDNTTGFCKPNATSPPSSCTRDSNNGINTIGVYFRIAPYTGSRGACAKKRWANSCTPSPVAWEGITYGITDPCNNV
jgi:hypothetical protein